MPITCERLEENSDEEQTFTSFVYKARWFVLSETDGQELEPITIPEWDAEPAIKTLNIERVPFDHTDGNVHGFARGRQLAINPLAQTFSENFFHECAHILLHTGEGDFADGEATPRNLREVEAEAVALLCYESLGLEGAEFNLSPTLLIFLHLPTRLGNEKRSPEHLPATSELNGGHTAIFATFPVATDRNAQFLATVPRSGLVEGYLFRGKRNKCGFSPMP